MDSSQGPIAESSTLIARTGIPRRVLSRLLSVAEVGVGYRVLLVGCGHGELAAYFDSLGIACAGIDESPANVMEARRAAAACDFTCASAGDPFPGPKAGFDLVLVRDASVFQNSLLSSTALISTLQLATRLRPGGRLTFLARIGEGAAAGAHGLSCYTRHFRSLPWRCDFHDLPDGLGLGRSFRSQPAAPVGSGYAIAVLRLPAERLSQQEWAHLTDVAAHSAGTCCAWGARGSDSAGYRSKAA